MRVKLLISGFFVLRVHLYQTSWFPALCLAVLLVLLVALYQLKLQRLIRAERKIRETLDTLPAMAWVMEPDGTNRFVNQRCVDYTGFSLPQTAGEGWTSIVHPDDRDRYLRQWRACVAAGQPFEGEVRFRRADGAYRWFLNRAVALRDRRGNIVSWYGVSSDIEDRKRAEQLQAELAHINRVSTMGELAASISHELRQPLTAAMVTASTGVNWLKRDKPQIEKALEALEGVLEDGARANEIIDRLRSLYKKTPPKREPLAVNEVIGEMIALLRSEGTRHAISIRSDPANHLPEIVADRVQIQQVLMNLVLNGIEAMSEIGGVLTIKSQLREDGQIEISVSDTGPGLPSDGADRIFDAFFTTKPQGSGMGLAICMSIVESHDGRIWANGNGGRGATFYFMLPARPADTCTSTDTIRES